MFWFEEHRVSMRQKRQWPKWNARHGGITAQVPPPSCPPPVEACRRQSEVAHLVKLYKPPRAVDDVTFRIARGSITGCSAATAPARPPPSP
jgi:hypothetical protein